MTRFLFRITVVAVFVCIGVVFISLAVGRMLHEEEISLNGNFGSRNLNIYRMSIEHRISVALTHDPSDEWVIGWSHDGQQIAFVSETPVSSGIYLMDAEGHGIRRLTNEIYPIQNPIWSSDNQSIAYIRKMNSYPQLMLLDVQTSHVQTLTDGLYKPESPIWSPDGTQIAFISSTPNDNHKNIYTINTQTGHVDLLASNTDLSTSLSWSPDGSQIIFLSYNSRNKQFDIESVDIQSGSLRLLVRSANSPVLSPDGHFLLYLNVDPISLYLFDMTSEKTSLLYTGPIIGSNIPNWSQDGRSILYLSYSTTLYQLDAAECLRQSGRCSPKLVQDKTFSSNPRWRPHQP